MRRLFWRIYATYLIVVVLCDGRRRLARRAALRTTSTSSTRPTSSRPGRPRARGGRGARRRRTSPPSIEPLVRRMGDASGTRITIIATGAARRARRATWSPTRTAAPRTWRTTPTGPSSRRRSAASVGRAVRRSPTLDEEMMYVAVPLESGGQVSGGVRAAMPLTSVNDALDSSLPEHLRSARRSSRLVAALSAGIVSRRIARPMREVARGRRALRRR